MVSLDQKLALFFIEIDRLIKKEIYLQSGPKGLKFDLTAVLRNHTKRASFKQLKSLLDGAGGEGWQAKITTSNNALYGKNGKSLHVKQVLNRILNKKELKNP